MAVRKITIKKWDTSVWDDIYPKTTIDQVINLSTALANLQSDIDGKEPSITKGTTSQYFRGDMTLATFPTIPSLPTAMSVSEGSVGTATTLRSMRADYLKKIIEYYTGVDRAVDTKTANYTLVLADNGKTILINSTFARTITIPANSSVIFPIGSEIHIIRQGTGEVTIAINTDTLLSEGSKKRINAQYQAVTLKKITSTSWVIIGALKT